VSSTSTSKKDMTMIREYDSSMEALDGLLSSNQITEISTSISRLANGTEYSFVEVTCGDGAQYGLQAW